MEGAILWAESHQYKSVLVFGMRHKPQPTFECFQQPPLTTPNTDRLSSRRPNKGGKGGNGDHDYRSFSTKFSQIGAHQLGLPSYAPEMHRICSGRKREPVVYCPLKTVSCSRRFCPATVSKLPARAGGTACECIGACNYLPSHNNDLGGRSARR